MGVYLAHFTPVSYTHLDVYKRQGYEWLNSFLRRNQEIRIRNAEGLSLARAEGMSKEEVCSFFNILKDVFDENNFYSKPGNIFNLDETGCQLNNEPGKVLASKGVRDVHVLTSGERGENVSVIACCNAEGTFLPPVLIFKGKNENPAFPLGLPPGSDVYMNAKSSYITSELFFKWLKNHFTPRKPPGKVLLVMDGHSSHHSSVEMLEFADDNDIILVCLPSHTTQALQPLDRSFFQPFKTFYKKETMAWVQHNKKSIKKVHAGTLIGNAWIKSATAENAINGFRATGIFPLNSDAIPEHFFSISNSSVSPASFSNVSNNGEHVSQETSSHDDGLHHLLESNHRDESSINPSTSQTEEAVICSKETPTKHLHEISPVPVLEKKISKRKQSAKVLDKQFIKLKKAKVNETFVKEKRIKKSLFQKTKLNEKKKLIKPSTRSDSDEDPGVACLDSISLSDEENKCTECFEDYFKTTSTADWVQCCVCNMWMHEDCTIYGAKCNTCGRKDITK